jgi:hypothetical protein
MSSKSHSSSVGYSSVLPSDPIAVSGSQPVWLTATGWVFTGLVCAGLTFSAIMKFLQPPDMLKGLEKIQLDPDLLVPIGIVEIVCVLIYLFPRTAILGAILTTGYLGGAILTHVRVHDNFAAPIVVGILCWLGIFLREPRLRSILFWR